MRSPVGGSIDFNGRKENITKEYICYVITRYDGLFAKQSIKSSNPFQLTALKGA
jgi:hypothetical protein